MPPAALYREGKLPLDGAAAKDLERNALLYISGIAQPGP
jgi:hypothetical protein